MRPLAFFVLALAAFPAAAADRARIVLNGTWNPAPADFTTTRSFTEYVETGSLSTRYSAKDVFGPDIGVQVTLFRQLGVYAAYALATRDQTGSFEAAYPHPLYLNRPRRLSGELTGYELKESAAHLDLAYGGARGHIDYALFAGVSFWSVEADLVESVRYSQSYPYDEVTLSQLVRTRPKDSPTGFNAGGRLDYRFGKPGRVGLGVQLRYSAAKAKLPAGESTVIDIDVGGFQAGAGIRFYF
jgi:hypothetical protein